MSPAPPVGPRCEACGCTAQEHQHLVDESWHLVPARCLSCDCAGFVAGGVTVAGFVYDDVAGGVTVAGFVYDDEAGGP